MRSTAAPLAQHPQTLLGAAWLLLQARQTPQAAPTPEQLQAGLLLQALAERQAALAALNSPKYRH
jgi:hypothetical protein